MQCPALGKALGGGGGAGRGDIQEGRIPTSKKLGGGGVEVWRKELLVALVKHLGALHPNLVVSVSGLSEIPKPRISTFLLSCLSDMWADVLVLST